MPKKKATVVPTLTEAAPKNKGGWSASKKFRMQLKKLGKHLTQQEIKWKARADATCKVFSPDEVRRYCEERGLPFASPPPAPTGEEP